MHVGQVIISQTIFKQDNTDHQKSYWARNGVLVLTFGAWQLWCVYSSLLLGIYTDFFRSSNSSLATTSSILNPAPNTAKTTTTSRRSSSSSAPSPNLCVYQENGRKKSLTGKANFATSTDYDTGLSLTC